MRKEDICSLFVYLVMIAIALIVGLTAVSDAFKNMYNLSFNSFGFTIIVLLVGLLFNIVMLEVFHVIGGKIGKYAIVSFNFLGFCWAKNNNKWKFSFKDFDGLTGETKLAPKSEKSKLTAYIWLPILGYIIELIVCIIIFTLGQSAVHDSPLKWMGVASLLFIIISSMIALYNIVPLKLDSMTDGYRMVLSAKPINVEALNEVMRIENLQREGKPVDKVKIFNEITEFTANVNLYSVYEDLSRGEYEKAEKIIDNMLESKDKISPSTANRLVAQKLYIRIVTCKLSEAEEFYNKEVDDDVRRFISNDLSMESLRAYVLIAGLLDKSIAEVQYANSRKQKAMKRALASRAEIEEKLYDDAVQRVLNEHKDWDLSKEA